jgi:arabinogalactan endo-1,4-beta-galactosidase
MAIHYYGTWNDTATPKKYIKNVHNRYGKNVWITEMGTTMASAGTNTQTRTFMNTMLNWVDSQSYIERVAWTGAFGFH